ncbi:MAG: VWA domain-containing protein [Pirellulaceae bacterium]|nr:VWA domain-containing protein [Pirellulaceae bacterium]
MRTIASACCVPALLFGISTSLSVAAEPAGRPVAQLALESIFSPRHAPAAKTMGLLQRSFLDLVETSPLRLQVALVVDGTDSMSESLGGIEQAILRMAEDLRRYKGANVSFQFVVYRDTGAPSGEVEFPLNTRDFAFSNDDALLRAAVAKLRAETGEPYFPELIDLGIHEALTRLPWSDDPQTERWLMVFADAPPYDAGFDEKETGARRRFDTERLIAIASRKGIKVHCILCPSRAEDRAVYEQVLDKTQQFLNRMATDTGGLMLDLSYPDIQRAVAQAATAEPVAYRRIGQITAEEIELLKQQLATQQTPLTLDRRMRFAVLPHLPLEKMAFDPDRTEVQLSAELRHKLRLLPGVEVKSPATVERQLAVLRGRDLADTALLQALAVVLDVDYVVWGSLDREPSSVLVRSAIYDRLGGRQLVQESIRTGADLPVTKVGGQLASNLIRGAVGGGMDQRLALAMRPATDNTPLQNALLTPVSNVPAARDELLAGFEALEQALACPAGDPESLPWLDRCEASLNRVLATNGDPSNPFAQILLASCQFNQAQVLLNAGRDEEARAKSQACRQAVNLAYRFRNNAQYDYLRTEIEADYNLLFKKDYEAAIRLYEQLAQGDPKTPLSSSLRATWMLGGIYSGDWGVPAQWVDESKARQQLVKILAVWPDSREADYIRRYLRWDEAKGTNQFTYLPQEQNAVVQRMDDAER